MKIYMFVTGFENIAAYNFRSCSSVLYIPEASRDFKDSSQLKEMTGYMEDLSDKADSMKLAREETIQATQGDRDTILTEIKTDAENLIQRIKELEQKSMDIVNDRCDIRKNTLKDEVNHIDQIISDVQTTMASLSIDLNESQLFVNVKRARDKGKDIEMDLDTVPHDKVNEKFQFWKRPEINNIMELLKELSNMVHTEKIYTAKYLGCYGVDVTASDKGVCSVAGSCLLPDGTIMATDWDNKTLKRIAAMNRVTGHLCLQTEVWDVACTAANEVAVTLTNMKKVQIVNVGGIMTMKSFFSTSDCCRGICFSNEELFVSCGGLAITDGDEGPGHVSVYNLGGDC